MAALRPVTDLAILGAAEMLFALSGPAIRARHDQAVAAMTPEQLSAMAREVRAARAGCLRAGSHDERLDEVCRLEAAALRSAAGRLS